MAAVLITAREAAQHFGVQPVTLRRWARLGLIPAIRTPLGSWRVDAAAVAQMATPTLEEHTPQKAA